MNELAPSGALDLSPRTFEQAITFSQYLAESDFVPKDFKGKPGNCLIAMQWGVEIGLKPLQAMQNLAIVNGRPSLWGDAMLALVRASPLCEYVIEENDGTTATCRTKRRGAPVEQVETFTMDDAKKAGLLGKQGPWSQYPKRMLKLRARGFLLRDVYPDVLRGMAMAEELMDMPVERHMGAVDDVGAPPPPPPPPPPAQPVWPMDAFDKQLPRWAKAVAEGLKSPDDILALAQSKGALTPTQEAAIRALMPTTPAPKPEANPPWDADTQGFVDAMDQAGGSRDQA